MKTTNPKKRALLDGLKDGLIVSCQVQKDDPIYTDDIVVKMAEAAKWAGAVAIRANSPEQIKAIKDKVDLPMIGLWKIWHDDTDVFITPTMDAARAVWEAGAEIIALDCTSQITHENTQAWDLIKTVKQEIPEAIIFADVSNMEEAARAVENGAEKPPCSTIAGIRTAPRAATVAGPEPEIAPKKQETITHTIAIPPFLCPTQVSTKLISLREIPAFAMIFPDSTKNGIARRRNLLIPEYIFVATMVSEVPE